MDRTDKIRVTIAKTFIGCLKWSDAGVSDVQGFQNPPRVWGKGKEGWGQGHDFQTLEKPLPLVRVGGLLGVCWGFVGGCLSNYIMSKSCPEIKYLA